MEINLSGNKNAHLVELFIGKDHILYPSPVVLLSMNDKPKKYIESLNSGDKDRRILAIARIYKLSLSANVRVTYEGKVIDDMFGAALCKFIKEQKETLKLISMYL